MNFNSPQYLVFIPVVVVGYILVRRTEGLRDLWLLVASYCFYMSWNWKYAGLILASTCIDYVLGRWLVIAQQATVRRMLLVSSLCANLGLLGLFKYFDFFMDLTKDACSIAAIEIPTTHLNLLLPVGISFYTFQTLSYTIDIYRREIKEEKSFVKFALYVSFFPQLVAGPIVRAKTFLPQLHRDPLVRQPAFNAGLFLIAQGLFKKIVIADLLAVLAVDHVFAYPDQYSSWDLYAALCGYAFQIYNDFSGYSDIAIGSARLFGFHLPMNFNQPYLAADVREFWSRWHISLSTWLRDYLYIPLGGSRRGTVRTYVNLFITMVLGGLWHGAAINYLLWGVYHGVLLMLSHAMGRKTMIVHSVFVRRLICFHLILASWLLFRIGDMEQFELYVNGLAGATLGTRLSALYYVVLLCAVFFHCAPSGLSELASRKMAHAPAFAQGAAYAVLILVFMGCTIGTPAFIYFQF